MKKLILIACLLPCLFAFAGPDWADFSGKVVADGDTVSVLRDGTNTVKIRLNGIDCPEKRQAFGTRAKQFTSDLAFGKTVTVIEKEKDRYGRTVGEIILPDGRSLNRELVRAGFAWWYRHYAPKDAELEALEAEARAGKLGLWIDLNTAAPPVPPWAYRKEGKKAAR